MKINLKLISLTFCFLFSSFLLAAEKEDAIFRAMEDELQRSVQQLTIEEMSSPYFLSYRIRDYQTVNITARYGALVKEEISNDCFLYIDLRVGDYTLDNSNYYDTWRDIWKSRIEIVEEDDYNAIRHALWLKTDKAYKSALESLARKKAYLQSHPVKEEIADFARVEPYSYFGEAAKLDVKPSDQTAIIQEAGRVLDEFPKLQEWKIEYTASAINQWYINSEGSKNRTGNLYHILEISATAQAEDGQRLTNFRQYLTTKREDLPTLPELLADVRSLGEELEKVVNAPVLDEYVGPVLFTDFAAAQLLSQIMVKQLALPRDPLLSEDWMHQYFPVGKLAGKVKRRLFPEFVSIADEPLRTKWEDHSLVGTRVVDDEGVKCQNITLIDKGRLMTLPLGRQPTKKISESNGHAKSTPYQLVLPGISNLLVSTSQPQSMKKLTNKLCSLCREQDVEYGLLVKQLEEPRYSNAYRWIEAEEKTESLLTKPVVVYKVYAKDGRMEPVRGLVFDEVTVRNLRDIVAMGDDYQIYNMTQSVVYEDFHYSSTIVTPSILVEEMELKGVSVREPLPISANPIFE